MQLERCHAEKRAFEVRCLAHSHYHCTVIGMHASVSMSETKIVHRSCRAAHLELRGCLADGSQEAVRIERLGRSAARLAISCTNSRGRSLRLLCSPEDTLSTFYKRF